MISIHRGAIGAGCMLLHAVSVYRSDNISRYGYRVSCIIPFGVYLDTQVHRCIVPALVITKKKKKMMIMMVTMEVVIVIMNVYKTIVYFKCRIVRSYTRFKHNVRDCCTIVFLGRLRIRVFPIRQNIWKLGWLCEIHLCLLIIIM